MKCILVRNVKFSAAECNSFNMRKKNVGYLTSKKISGGSHAKLQPSRCKVTTIKLQSYKHQTAKLQPSRCKVATIKMQSCSHQDAKLQPSRCKITPIIMQSNIFRSVKLQTSKCNSKFFQLQLGISSRHHLPAPRRKAVCLKLHIYTV